MPNSPKFRIRFSIHPVWYDKDNIEYKVLRVKGNHVRLDYSQKLGTTFKKGVDISKKKLFSDFSSKPYPL